MAKRLYEGQLPDDLKGIAARLTERRAEVDSLKLDQLKQRALSQSTARNGRRTLVRSRLATLFTALVLLGGGGGALAVSQSDHHPDSHGGAADDQYRPGKGCGDKNHVHQRQDECKNDNDDHGSGGGGGDQDRAGRGGHQTLALQALRGRAGGRGAVPGRVPAGGGAGPARGGARDPLPVVLGLIAGTRDRGDRRRPARAPDSG